VAAGDECTTDQDRTCTPCPNEKPPFATWTGTYDDNLEMCEFACDSTLGRVADFTANLCSCAAGEDAD
jgi:hypothetical protein